MEVTQSSQPGGVETSPTELLERLFLVLSERDHLASERNQLASERDQLVSERDQLASERDNLRQTYRELLERFRKLEFGILSQRSERVVDDKQLSLQLLEALCPGVTEEERKKKLGKVQVPAHERRKRETGRQTLPERLPRIEIELLPEEVQQEGLNAFERIGEEVSEVLEHRRASMVVMRIVRPKFVARRVSKSKAAQAAAEAAAQTEAACEGGRDLLERHVQRSDGRVSTRARL